MSTFAIAVLGALGAGDVFHGLTGARRFGVAIAFALFAGAAIALTRLVESKGSLETVPGTTLALVHFVVVWLGVLLLAALTIGRDRGREFAIGAVALVTVDVLLQS